MKLRLLACALTALAFTLPAQADDHSKLTSVACLEQSATGSVGCDAVCPAGHAVLNCAHDFGPLTGGDTCEALSRVFAGPTNAEGQPSRFPHDRCSFYAACANGGQKLSVQGWATCYPE